MKARDKGEKKVNRIRTEESISNTAGFFTRKNAAVFTLIQDNFEFNMTPQ